MSIATGIGMDKSGTGRSLAVDKARLGDLSGQDDLLPLWITEPYVLLADSIWSANEERSISGWYGYETRPGTIKVAFWKWMTRRHGWSGDGLTAMVGPSVISHDAMLSP
ncbi:MAG: hypothetical protein QNL12_11760 [Acidimicrobiia bacterium]|nr:hypothetical protein [Acidimicrobiia bacterium]MDX2467983.1 hypothetical protein [Acidimicrobiia bacterium]